VLTNRDLEQMVDTSDAWIVERTGIRQRHIAAEGEASSDMAAHAARAALEAAGIAATELDLIVVATISPDAPLPSTAVLVQQKIGARNDCPAFDIAAAARASSTACPSPTNSSPAARRATCWSLESSCSLV
jgi:3-oxoacyl-[acyl-carrier-protein] synthase-3